MNSPQIQILLILATLWMACGNSPTEVSQLPPETPTEIPVESPKPIAFKDPNFEQLVRSRINKPTGDIYEAELDSVTYLWASEVDIEDLTGISHFKNLKRLELAYTKISNATDVRKLEKVEVVRIVSSKINDLSQFSGMKSITHLFLWQNQITDVNLTDLPSLEQLFIQENNIQTLTELSKLPKLSKVDIDKTGIKNLALFLQLPELTDLYISHNSIQDISIFREFESLKITRLVANDNLIEDMSPIENLTSIQSLWLQNNQIKKIQLPPNLTTISLDLANNQITKLDLPKSLTRIELLNLPYNHLTDISAMPKLEWCVFLDLSNNNITDISPLANIVKIHRVNLANNQITDPMPLVGHIYEIYTSRTMDPMNRGLLDLTHNMIPEDTLAKFKEADKFRMNYFYDTRTD